MNDRVYGCGYRYECIVGFHPHERDAPQSLLVDFEAETDWRAAARSDRPEGIVDYFVANQRIGEALQARSFLLIEAVAEEVARVLCEGFPIKRVRVKVSKPGHRMPNVGTVAVECVRTPDDFR